MTAISEADLAKARAQVESAPTPSKKKTGGIDYSKFDNIEDSDDEKIASSSKTAASEGTNGAEQPHCHNCHKDISKPLRCGVCKKVAYCSQQCQKDDWSFHKRNCKKPEAPKAAPSPKKPPSSSSSEKPRKKEEKVVVEDDDDVGTWYKHRDWKPDQEAKKEFKPTQLVEGASASAANGGAAAGAAPSAGSAWNAAGTWEEKDVTAHAQRTLGERLEGLPSVDAAGGAISILEVEKVEGDASKPVIRGRLRHMFDLTIKVKFAFRWMGEGGQKQADGTLCLRDFTNDTSFSVAEGDDGGAPVVEVTFKDASSVDIARRKAVEDAIGKGAWPAAAGSLLGHIADRMEAWSQDYQKEC